MATAITTIARSVQAIVNDLATTRQRIAVLSAEITDGLDPRHAAWDELDQRLPALENELKAAIYADTGVSWDLLARVMS